MVSFSTVAITSSKNTKKTLEVADQCAEILLSKKIKVLVSQNLRPVKDVHAKVQISSKRRISKEANLLICIGGDGTMLSSAREYHKTNIPLLGINLGKVGFLTDVSTRTMAKDLDEVLKGGFFEDERFFLCASINRKKYIALNEIVIHSGAIAQMIEYEVFIDNKFVYSQKSDGIILNSPTGSTAYSLSGGGPIIHPNLKSITLLPMFSQSLSTSPLVVDENSSISVLIKGTRNKAILSMDSHDSVILKSGDKIKIMKTDYVTTLIHPLAHDFYSACRNKLGWSTSQ